MGGIDKEKHIDKRMLGPERSAGGFGLLGLLFLLT